MAIRLDHKRHRTDAVRLVRSPGRSGLANAPRRIVGRARENALGNARSNQRPRSKRTPLMITDGPFAETREWLG